MSWLETLAADNRRLESWPKADRRDKRRSKVGLTFRISFDDLSLEPMTGRTRDFSRNGMYFISLPRKFRRGMRVGVELSKENKPNNPWRIAGKIVRVAKLPYSLYGIGIEFFPNRYTGVAVQSAPLANAYSFGPPPAESDSPFDLLLQAGTCTLVQVPASKSTGSHAGNGFWSLCCCFTLEHLT